jgi:hypothetical protein
MARVRLFGTEFNADPLYKVEGGWIMRSHAHTSRCSQGTNIFVSHAEIIEMAAAEQPGPVPPGEDHLEAAMAAERETLPSFAEVDAKNGNAGTRQERKAAYSKAVAVLNR